MPRGGESSQARLLELETPDPPIEYQHTDRITNTITEEAIAKDTSDAAEVRRPLVRRC